MENQVENGMGLLRVSFLNRWGQFELFAGTVRSRDGISGRWICIEAVVESGIGGHGTSTK